MYVPSEDEKKDPVLYASNVRQYMLKYSKLTPSDSTYADKLVYHGLLKGTGKSKLDAKPDAVPTVTAKAM